MRRRPPRSTPLDSSAASDVYKRQSSPGLPSPSGSCSSPVGGEMYRTGALVTALLFALAALLASAARESARVRQLGSGPSRAGGAVERCVSCHFRPDEDPGGAHARVSLGCASCHLGLSLIHISEPTRLGMISYA